MHSKSSPQKLNVKQSKNRDLMISSHTARSAQSALTLAAVLVSWCAIIFGAHSTQAQTVPPYPVGVWAPYGIGNNDLDPALVNNLGVVGIIVAENWDIVNPAPGVYDWSSVDSRIAQSKAAGFNYISLTIIDSSADTPQWLLDSLPVDQKIALLDIAPIHTTFCQFINTALYWNPTFHQARLDLIAAAGAKYTNDPAIVAVNMAAFANHDSNDWNIRDTIGPLVCPTCPQPPPTQCGTITLNQPSQWLAVGWSEPQMVEIGKETCDAAAAAFPNQNIKLPIGGLDITYPAFDGGTYTTMCRGIQDYVYGNASLGIPPRDYANRFFMQRNTVAANWQVGTYFDTYVPGFNADPYIKYMIRAHAHPNPPWTTPGQAGLQMVAAAVLGATTDCRQGGGPDGPCGPTCDPTCVMQTSLDVARTYGTAFIEIWAQDSVEPDFYDMIKATTIAMGGTPRNGLSADLSITVTDTGAVAGASDTYTIVVTNSGPNDVSGVGVADTLPTLLTGETFTATQTGGASGFSASGAGDINDTVTMPANSTITYIVTGLIRSSATGTLSNTATVTGPAGLNDPSANNSATDTSTITIKADLNVTVTDTGAIAGARDTYTIVVANPGPSDVTGAGMADTFPANFTSVSFTASQTGGASGYTHSGTGNINDTVTMPANSTITYVANGTIPSSATGTISDTATVTTPNGVNDPNSANNTAIDTSTITLTADFKVSVTDGKSSVVSGQSDTYTIVVTNSGPSNVPGAPVSDNFPAVFTGMSFTATQTGGASGFTASGSGNINDTVTMPSGSVITYTATGTISPSAPSGSLSDTATVTAPSGVTDNKLTNNSATDTDILTLQADLKITVTDGIKRVTRGQSNIYTIVVTNNGPGSVTGARVSDLFPAVFTGVSFTATQAGGASGFTASGSGNINDTVTMPSGSVITYRATGTIDPSANGTVSDTGTVTAPRGVTDNKTSNNTATDSDTVR